MAKYKMTLEPLDDEASPLLDENGILTRHGNNVVYEAESFGYIVSIEKVE